MNISIERNGSNHHIRIEGVIKSISDSQEIKDAINSCTDATALTLDIVDSFSVTSSVIGFLLKKRQADNLAVTIQAHDDRLYDLFKSLNLVEVLDVKKA